MRELRFLVPGTGRRFRCGGLQVELQTAALTGDLAPTEVVTYRERQADHPFLDDLLRAEPVGSPEANRALWIVSWGFDVPHMLRRLRGRAVAYHAHSSGYGFDLPPGLPVLAVSRNTLGYWGNRAPRSPLFLVPNALEAQWIARGDRAAGRRRPIDVLVQQRKSSDYVLNQLVPALRARGLRVEVQNGWVDDLVALFNSAAVVLYDSADYWRGRGVSEGFGLPPIEAMACGLPVITTRKAGAADLVAHGHTGWLVDNPRDVVGMAEGLKMLVESASLRIRMGQAGRAVAEQRTWDAVAEETMAVYKHVASMMPGMEKV